MKRFSQQFRKQSESIHLKDVEKSELKARLVSYMEYHPLPKEMALTSTSKKVRTEGILSEPFKVITFNTVYFRSIVGVFALLLIVSIPVVADHAVPGDVLYPVKIQFNEQLLSTLAISPYAKVQWDTERVERRVSEARLLASEGKLTSETETQVAQAVKSHTDAAQKEIAQLKQSDSDSAAIAEIALSSALAVQSQILEGGAQDASSSAQDGHSVAALAQVVAQARDSVAASQATTQPSYVKLLASIEQQSTRVSELFASVKKEASPDEIAAVERSLADIQRKIDEAQAIKNGIIATSSDNTDIADLLSSTSTIALQATTTTSENATTTATSSPIASTTDQSMATDTIVVPNVATSSVEASSSDTTAGTSTTPQAAIDLLKSALSDLQKVMAYLTNIDVRQSVSLQDLVPVTLTASERVSAITALFNDTRAIQTKIEGRDIDPELAAKVSVDADELENKLAQVVTAMKKGNLDGAQALVTEAHLMALDLDKLTSTDNGNVDTSVDTATSTSDAGTAQ